jgi:hypothetical protein
MGTIRRGPVRKLGLAWIAILVVIAVIATPDFEQNAFHEKDRGRENRLRSAPPPSEPDRRISRIRLSRW